MKNFEVRKERKAMQQESLCPLCSQWLIVFFAPAHERALPQPVPAVHTRLSRAGDEDGRLQYDGNQGDAGGVGGILQNRERKKKIFLRGVNSYEN